MKKLMTIGVAAMVIISTSCGGGKKNKEIAKVKPESTAVTGDLSDYLQIIENEYEIVDDWGGNLSIKVKGIKAFTDGDPKDKKINLSASLLGENGMPVSGTGEFQIEYSSKDKLNSLLKKGSGVEIIQLKAMLGDYSADEHAEKVKKFSVSSTVKEKEQKSNSSSSKVDNSYSNASNSEDWDTVLDDYEDYVDKYIKFYKKAMKGEMDALSEYPALMEKATSFAKKLENAKGDLSSKQVGRMTEIQMKMLKAAQDISN